MAEAPDDVRTRIDNALQLAAGTKTDDRYAVQRTIGALVAALRTAREAIDERDESLELLTAPDRDAAAELAAAKKDLESATSRLIELEQELVMAKQEREVEEHVHEEDRRRLRELEKRAKTFDKVIMDDDDAFERFMNQALDESERKGKKPPPR